MEIAQTPSSADGALHDPPEAFHRVEVGHPRGGEEVEAPLAVVVVEGRVELMRPVAPTAVDDQHHCLARFAADCHHVMEGDRAATPEHHRAAHFDSRLA